MKSQVICDALNTVNPTPAQRARMRAALEAQLPAEKPPRRGAHQQKASSQRWWTIIPAAAALFAVVLLGIFVLGRTDKTPPSMSNVPTAPLTLESLQSSANYKASMEINLLGYTVDEALNEVDKFLDSGMLRGQSTLYIIHGNGTGALRNAIQKHLRTHRGVKSFRLGRYGEGESGVTVVELK